MLSYGETGNVPGVRNQSFVPRPSCRLIRTRGKTGAASCPLAGRVCGAAAGAVRLETRKRVPCPVSRDA